MELHVLIASRLAAALLVAGLFCGILILLELGRRIGRARLARDPDGARAGVGSVEGAVFGLLGLLIAFTFSGAASRFETRRHLVVEEANAVGTAYLRIDLLPPEAQPALREKFRRYLDLRLEVYRRLPDLEAARAALASSTALQGEIWAEALAASRAAAPQPATVLLMPALNQMFDITTTRTTAIQAHPPTVIFAMLAGITLTSALLAGYGMAGGSTRNWLHILGYAAIMTVTVYVILDLEYPRIGLIRIDAADVALRGVRDGMR